MNGTIFSPEYIVCVLISFLLMLLAFMLPKITRTIVALIFVIAAAVNTIQAITMPQIYRAFADVTFSPWYEKFINGFFSEHIGLIVMAIAVMQLVIGLGIVAGNAAAKYSLLAATIFLAAITPLAAGSAFPSPIFLAVACIILIYKNKTHHAGRAYIRLQDNKTWRPA